MIKRSFIKNTAWLGWFCTIHGKKESSSHKKKKKKVRNKINEVKTRVCIYFPQIQLKQCEIFFSKVVNFFNGS